jgi:hypothetical protein
MFDLNERMQVGVLKPEKEPASIDEMRKAIIEASRNSAIVRNAMYAADHRGLSGEDRYVQLAYYALRNLQDSHVRFMDFVAVSPVRLSQAGSPASGNRS